MHPLKKKVINNFHATESNPDLFVPFAAVATIVSPLFIETLPRLAF